MKIHISLNIRQSNGGLPPITSKHQILLAATQLSVQHCSLLIVWCVCAQVNQGWKKMGRSQKEKTSNYASLAQKLQYWHSILCKIHSPGTHQFFLLTGIWLGSIKTMEGALLSISCYIPVLSKVVASATSAGRACFWLCTSDGTRSLKTTVLSPSPIQQNHNNIIIEQAE